MSNFQNAHPSNNTKLEKLYEELEEKLSTFPMSYFNVLNSIESDKVGQIFRDISSEKYERLKQSYNQINELLKTIFEEHGFSQNDSEKYINVGLIAMAFPRLFRSVASNLIHISNATSAKEVIENLKNWFSSQECELLVIVPFLTDCVYSSTEVKLSVDKHEYELLLCENLLIDSICYELTYPICNCGKFKLAKFICRKVGDFRQVQKDIRVLVDLFGIYFNAKCFKLSTIRMMNPLCPFKLPPSFDLEYDSLRVVASEHPELFCGNQLVSLSEAELKSFAELCENYLKFDSSQKEKLNIAIERLNYLKFNEVEYLNRENGLREGRYTVNAWIELRVVLEILLKDKPCQGIKEFIVENAGMLLTKKRSLKRHNLKNNLKKLYEIASDAIHKGRAANSNEELALFKNGIEICSELIKLYITEGCFPDFIKLRNVGIKGAFLKKPEIAPLIPKRS